MYHVRRSILNALVLVAFLAVLLLVAPVLDAPLSRLHPQGLLTGYQHTVLIDVAINIILALGLNLILGMTGQFSLGHAGFLAAGAYTAIVIAGKPDLFLPQLHFYHEVCHLPAGAAFTLITLSGLLAGAVVAGVLGLLVGLPALRLRGDYLAIATLGFGEIVAVLITNSDFLGTSTGLHLYGMLNEWLNTVAHQPATLAPVVGEHLRQPYLISSFWVFLTVAFALLILRNIKYSTTGRALLAIREDPIASESVGIPTTRYKVASFVIGAALAGLAGGILAHHKPLNPESFRFMRSIEVVLMVVLGGQGSITGVVLAAAAITVLPEALRSSSLLDAATIEKWRMVLYSLAIILVMLFRPQGLFGRFELPDLFRALRIPFSRRARQKRLATVFSAPSSEISNPQSALSPPHPITNYQLPITPPPLAPSTPLLALRSVGMSFGGLRAVDQFNLALLPGELVGLIGPNGAGKTTVFNLLTGVYTPTDGTMTFRHQPIAGLSPHVISQRGIARTFQNIRLFANLTVLDNVQIAQHVHHTQGIPSAVLRTPAFFAEEAASRQAALDFLRIFHLQHLANERANSLSYGDQRRLEIARALATRPQLLLLDEPAAGMNPTEKRQLMDLIHSIRDRFALTILLIEHDMQVVMGICQRILVLDYGKTIAEGPPAEIRKNPAVIAAYLGASAKHG